jgi:hypothetical protein
MRKSLLLYKNYIIAKFAGIGIISEKERGFVLLLL